MYSWILCYNRANIVNSDAVKNVFLYVHQHEVSSFSSLSDARSMVSINFSLLNTRSQLTCVNDSYVRNKLVSADAFKA